MVERFKRLWIGVAVLAGVAAAAYLAHRAAVEGGPPAPRLVERLGYSPPLVTLPEGTLIRFSVETAAVPLDELEFRLLESSKAAHKWTILQDWRDWPLEPVVAASGRTALQVDVRRKNDPTVVDQRWLGQLYVEKGQEQRAKNCLMRNLLADDFDQLDESAARAALAREAWLAIHLLLWEHQSFSVAEKLQALRTLPGVASADLESTGPETAAPGKPPPGTIRVMYHNGDGYRYDPARLTFREDDSPVSLDLSLAAYPEFAKVFRLAARLSPRARAVVGLTYFVCTGYLYGTPPFNPSVRAGVAHCASGSTVLLDCLQQNGVDAELAIIGREDGSTHVLVQAIPTTGEPLLLDSTIGLVYRANFRTLTLSSIPAPLVLPPVRVFPGLDLPTLLDGSCEVLLCRGLVDGVTPIAPEGESEVLRFP